MKLWILTIKRGCSYDEYDAFVVRARSEVQARAIAADNKGDEGPQTWLLESNSSCEELTADGEAGLVLGSFNAG